MADAEKEWTEVKPKKVESPKKKADSPKKSTDSPKKQTKAAPKKKDSRGEKKPPMNPRSPPKKSGSGSDSWGRGEKVSKKQAGKYNNERKSPYLGPKKDPTNSPGSRPKRSPKQGPARPRRARIDSMDELRLDALDHKSTRTKSPYIGPTPTKDRMKEGDPACVTYFGIRTVMTDGTDNVYALKRLLPQAVVNGQDFKVWPRQCLLLHGLVKQGCVDCVTYLVKDLGFDINSKRQKDGCTPLHNAFYNLNGPALERMVHKLVELGADESVKNKYGEPPCMFKFKADASPSLTPKTINDLPGGFIDDLDDLSLGASVLTPTASSGSGSPTAASGGIASGGIASGGITTSASIFAPDEALNRKWRESQEKVEAPPAIDIEVIPAVKKEYSKQLPTPKSGAAAEMYEQVKKASMAE